MLHALDADHIMAVSSLSMRSKVGKPWGLNKVLGFCFRWALGHGAVLVSLTLLLLLIGLKLPPIIPLVAEKLIGILLILIGSWIIYSLCTRKLVLKLHTHNDVTHLHLTKDGSPYHNHQPTLIGITHGIAGSAPILALIPATTQDLFYIAMLYVLLFSLGVMLSMMVFGLLLGRLQHWIIGLGQQLFKASQITVAALAIAFGGYWLAV